MCEGQKETMEEIYMDYNVYKNILHVKKLEN